MSGSENEDPQAVIPDPTVLCAVTTRDSHTSHTEEEDHDAGRGAGHQPERHYDENDDRIAHDDDDDDKNKKLKPPHQGDLLGPVKSYATGASLATVTTATAEPPPPKPWYRNLNPLRWGGIPPVPRERIVSREYQANFLSRMWFQWMAPLMTTGYKRPLEPNDIWKVNPDRAVAPLTDKFAAAFKRHVAARSKYPLWWALHDTFRAELWSGGAYALLASVLQVMSPFTLRYLIQFAADAYAANQRGEPTPHQARGFGMVVGITLMQIGSSLATHHYVYNGMMIGGQSRGVLIGMIFEKSMVLSGRARAGGKAAITGPERGSDENESKKKKTKKEIKEQKQADADIAAGYSTGRISTIMSVDTSRIDTAGAFFHNTWTAPVASVIVLALLLVNLTYSALAGFALLVLGVPLLTRVMRSLFARRRAINSITDKRVSLMQELLQAVRFVKYFSWEESFLDRLQLLRDREISSIRVLLAMRNGINSVSMSLPLFASMLSFITYSLTGHGLQPAQVFSSLALYNALRIPLNIFPLALGQSIDAWSSLKRIQDFLLAEEQADDAAIRPDAELAIELAGASFTWEQTRKAQPTDQDGQHQTAKEEKEERKEKAKQKKKDEARERKEGAGEGKEAGEKRDEAGVKRDEAGEKRDEEGGGATRPPSAASTAAGSADGPAEPFNLRDIQLQVGRGELVAVIGGVGSGKTSLLAALAGDMRKTGGEVIFGASRAFCPQYAWIQNATVQDNILFGKKMRPDWYAEVIRACALTADLEMLPDGDQTEIGERGITISGGQKQRLNIARAIYFSADVVLMDDPLSAVDAHVGRHIFDHAILGLMKDKCRILATHQLWVLSRCDRVVWMDEGRIRAVDTFTNLMERDPAFRQLLETTAVEEKKEDEAGEEEAHPTDDTRRTDGTDGKGRNKSRRRKRAGLMQQEERAVNSVSWSVYAAYARASGNVLRVPLLLLMLILSQGSNIVSGLWLTWWTSDRFGFQPGVYMGVYASLGLAQATLMFVFSVMLTILGTRASGVLFRQAAYRVLRAPMSFFDTSPLGRILNRFSRDVDVMDNNLNDAFRMYLFTLSMLASVFALTIAYFYWFAVALVPLFGLFLVAASYYRASAREVKRIESVIRSTVFARFGEGLLGAASIKAYGVRDKFVDGLRYAIDEMNAAYYLTFSNQRWLSTRLDMIGNLLVFVTGILVVTARFSVNPSVGGLVLSYVVTIVQVVQFSVRQLAEVENGMNSVERLLHYGTKLEEEAPAHTVDVPDSWPDRGEIVFDRVEMRYRPELPLVLRGLSMRVGAGERVGIVGRTGAGKSSIVSTLFRLCELSGGHITIDGRDISTIGLHDLRSRLAIIPQDPTLFRGTVRSNLDPFSRHADAELWDALRSAGLVREDQDQDRDRVRGDDDLAIVPAAANANANAASRITLDSTVEEDGLNFSLGQRQMMALARALVRGARVIVCDEATSSVDVETDDKIQRAMVTGFRGSTLLCIAHRLRTILNYDRVCVMDGGRIAELDTPANLWRDERSIFRGMCDRGGIRGEDVPGLSLGTEEEEGDEGTGEGEATIKKGEAGGN